MIFTNKNTTDKRMKKLTKMAVVLKRAMYKQRKNPQLIWDGNRVDLMEMVYGMYLSGKVKTVDGRKATLYEISEMTFEAFGMKAPKNPSRILTSLRGRTDPRKLSIIYKALCSVYPGFFQL